MSSGPPPPTIADLAVRITSVCVDPKRFSNKVSRDGNASFVERQAKDRKAIQDQGLGASVSLHVNCSPEMSTRHGSHTTKERLSSKVPTMRLPI
ncbi:hypothetical protein PM082_002625 [Marasmius tenuissimus]|nr:hypothetical protein PM082_002625 [Marasmius tenuissimus]